MNRLYFMSEGLVMFSKQVLIVCRKCGGKFKKRKADVKGKNKHYCPDCWKDVLKRQCRDRLKLSAKWRKSVIRERGIRNSIEQNIVKLEIAAQDSETITISMRTIFSWAGLKYLKGGWTAQRQREIIKHAMGELGYLSFRERRFLLFKKLFVKE